VLPRHKKVLLFSYKLQQVEDFLEEEKLFDILQGPIIIFYDDKSDFKFFRNLKRS
jgi:hypothetical protein